MKPHPLWAVLARHGLTFVRAAGGVQLVGHVRPPPEVDALVDRHFDELLVDMGRRLTGGVIASTAGGRCDQCAHWEGPDEFGDGLCLLGRRAHGWLDGNPDLPVLCTAHHHCSAYGGLGFEAAGELANVDQAAV